MNLTITKPELVAQTVSEFQYLTYEQASPKWAKFVQSIVCPECGDNKGHAGVFPRENDQGQLLSTDKGVAILGYVAHCLKCDGAFILKDRDANFDPTTAVASQDSFNFRKAAATLSGAVTFDDPDYTKLDSEYRLLNSHFKHNVPAFSQKTIDVLTARGYSASFTADLIKQGFGYYEKLPVAYNAPNAYYRMPCFRKEANDITGSHTSVLYSIDFTGLLLPLMQDGLIVGQRVRNISDEGPKYRPLAIPSKIASEKQRKEHYMPVHTLLNTDLPDDELTDPKGDLMIVEGELKAHVLKYHFKKMVLGVCGVNNFNNDKVRRVLYRYATRTLVIVPDKDYTKNYAVANNTWKLIQWATDSGFKVRILEWFHPDANVRESLKGVDDAIVRANTDDSVSFHYISKYEFFAKMYTKVRTKVVRAITGMGVSIGQVVTELELESLKDVIQRDDSVVLAKPDLEYALEDRVNVTYTALAMHKLVVDLSPTGSGKSHTAGLYMIDDINTYIRNIRLAKDIKKFGNVKSKQLDFGSILKEADVDMGKAVLKPEQLQEFEKLMKENTIKRVIHVSQSPINNTVETIERFVLRIGRNAHGWVYDEKTTKYRAAKEGEKPLYEPNCPQADNIIVLREQRQVVEIQRDICTRCPLRAGCSYLKEISKLSKANYIRQTLQSLSVKLSDFIIFDDFGGQEHFLSMTIDHRDVAQLFNVLDHRPKWKKEALLVKELVNTVLKTVKSGKRGRHVFEEMYVRGLLKKYPIAKWLSMDEPDRIPTQMIKLRSNGQMEFGEDYLEFKNLKRWFFMFLNVLKGVQLGDIYYDSKTQAWVVKGVDPKFRDIYNTAAAVLVLDATANRDYIKLIFGVEPYIISSPGDPLANINVKQVVGFQNTHKSSINFRGGHETVAKIDWITADIRNRARKAGVITFKSLLDKEPFADKWEPGIVKGWWFFSERASNEYYQKDVNTLYLMGVPIPNLNATAAEVDGDGDISTTWVARPWGPVKADGKRDYIVMKDVMNKELRNLLWYKRSASYIQAAGRLRSLRRDGEDLELVIMDNIALPFAVNEVITLEGSVKKELVTLASNETFRQVSFLQGVHNALIRFREVNGEELTRDKLAKLNGLIDFNVLFNIGVRIGSSSTITSMLQVVESKMNRVNTEPLIAETNLDEDVNKLTAWFNKSKSLA